MPVQTIFLQASLESLSFLPALLFLIVMLVVLSSVLRATEQETVSSWRQKLPPGQYSSKEIYDTIIMKLETCGVPGITFSGLTYPQGNLFSNRREYLRIFRAHLVFDICAAPFANEFFVSWYMGTTKNMWQGVLTSLPLIGKGIAAGFYRKTFYMQDAEALYRELVHRCVTETIEGVTTVAGVRAPAIVNHTGLTQPIVSA